MVRPRAGLSRAAARAAGRELLGPGESLAVARFRARLLGRLPLPPGRGGWALDVGCGDGLEAQELLERGWKVQALDLEPHPRWQALGRAWGGRLRFRVASDRDIAGMRGSYGLVFQKDVLHHVPEPAGLLASLKRLTAPGGELWALECNRLNPLSYLHLTLLKGHQHFTASRLLALAERAGLGGAALSRSESRVWPVERAAFQAAVETFQDALEALPFWRPLAVYNILRWRKPARHSRSKA